MKRLIGLILLLAVFVTNGYSQAGCTPNPNPTPGPDCPSAPFLCCGEVHGLSGTLPVGQNLAGPNPLCPGTSNVPNNIEWVSFAAGSTDITMIMDISACSSGNGVQVGVWSGCDFSGASNVFCNGAENFGMTPINLNNLVIGEVYHIFIDGFSGAVCDYSFTVTTGSTVSPEPFSPPSVSGTTVLCESAVGVDYFAGLGLFSTFNNWTVSDPSVAFNDNGASITITDWGAAAGGTVQICAEGMNDCFQNPTGMNIPCISVMVNANQMIQETGQYCDGECGYTNPRDGICYPEGVYNLVYPDPNSGVGCELEVELTVTQFIPETTNQYSLLCPGEALIVEGTPYFPPFTGVIQLNSMDANGCNPFLALDLQSIDTSASIDASTLVLDCDQSQALLTADINFNPQITYTFIWDTYDGSFIGNTTLQTIIANGPGTYTLEIIMEGFDDNGLVQCQSTPVSITITQDMGGPDLSSTAQGPASCGTTSNGWASVTPTGGASPYTYLWDDPLAQVNQTATGLAAGTYQVTVTDNTGCASITQVQVFATPIVDLSLTSSTDVLCFSDLTGDATVNATGGTGMIDYTWDVGGITGPTATGLAAGMYQVIATDQAGCADTVDVTIMEPLSAVAVTVDLETNTACGQATGGINITPSGGAGGYTFMWSDLSTWEDLSGVSAGVYQVTVRDANGCTIVASGSVDNADGPTGITITPTDVSCFGRSDGSIDLEFSGGTSPYMTVWDNGAGNDQDPTSLPAGPYNVTITDALGCSATGSTTINEPDLFTVMVNATQTECNGATGDLFTTTAGGSAIAMYQWDNGAGSSANPEDLPEGTYNVTVTDINGCTATGFDAITEPDPPMGSAMPTDASCFDADDGSITVTMTSPGTFSYDWGVVGLNDAPTNGGLAPDVYTIIVTDANMCTATYVETVGEPDIITAMIATDPTLCFGQNDGSATVTPGGGTGTGYTYQWCNGESTPTASSLLSGPCTVEVEDDSGCSLVFNLNIDDAPILVADTNAVVNLLCFEDGMGAIDLEVSGGTPGYTYDWSGGSIPNTTQDPAGLDAGIYTVEIEDDNGCTIQITNIIVDQPAELDIVPLTADASCNLPNGTIDVTVNGGTGNIDYTFSPPLPGNTGTHINSVASGPYSLEVRDANGCSTVENIEVMEPNALAVEAEVGSLLDCFGDSDGTASVTISGGAMPYDYDWGSASAANSSNIGGLSEGVYNVIVTDDNDCVINASVVVDEPAELMISLAGSVDPECDMPTGSIDITVQGGTVAGDYNYDWNSGLSTDQDLSGLGSGSYIVNVTDDNGCPATETFGIQAPDSFTPSENSTDLTCNNQDDGTISITIPDGSGTFTYVWSDTGILDTPNATGLEPGLYTVTITDDITDCINMVSVQIDEPDSLVISGITDDPSCLNNDGEITANLSGGTGALGITWSGPNSYSSMNPIISGLESGNYVGNITDANGCPGTLLVTLDPPVMPTLAAMPNPVNCWGENSGSITASGATPNGGFTYAWSDASIGNMAVADSLLTGMYNVTITDDEFCTAVQNNIFVDTPTEVTLTGATTISDCDTDNGTITLMPDGGVGGYTFDWFNVDGPLPPTQDLAAVGPGNYDVTVRDANGCPVIDLFTVTSPNPATLSDVITPATCYEGDNGSIALTVVGTGNYGFSWSDPSAVGQNPSGLAAGIYSVTVSDDDNCETFGTYTIADGVEITLTGDPTPDVCGGAPDGSIDLTVLTGTGPFMFDWDRPTTDDVEDPTLLGNGTHTVTVTDANMCPAVQTFVLNDPDATQFATDPIDNLCFEDELGQATVNITSGTAPFDITWTDDLSNVISTITLNSIGTDAINALAAGTYFVEIIDANNCLSTSSIVITEPNELFATDVAQQSARCNGELNGNAIVQPMGGTMPYSYLWDDQNNSTTQEITGLAGNQTYNVTVTDMNGCTELAAIPVDEPPLLVVTPSSTSLLCNDDTNATISLQVDGGNNGNTFDWNIDQYDGLDQLTGLSAGDYIVTVRDALGCEDIQSLTIDNPAGVELEVTAVSSFEAFNVSCFGFDDGFIRTSAQGGSGMLSYLWNDANASTTSDLMDIEAGDYTLVVTDENGCDETIDVSLAAPPEITVEFEEVDVRCFGDVNGALIITNTTGGAGDFVFSLDSALSGTTIFNGLAAGEYTLTGEDANGCPTESIVNIEEPSELGVEITSDSTVTDNVIELEWGDTTNLTASVTSSGTNSILTWGNQEILCPLGNCASIPVGPRTTTTYRVEIIDENGCVSEDDIVVRVRKNRDIYIPNVFSPTSNNPNNSIFQFFPGTAVEQIQDFIVVDRWGEIVFRIPAAFDPRVGRQLWGWDGTLNKKALNPAVFVYYAKVRFKDGEVIEYAGDVTLLK